MVGFGMSAMDAIKSATSRAAEMLDMKGEIGVLAPGAYADVIGVSADPLKDITALGKVTFVMHDGGIYKNDAAK
jgi:imidazolonepropionase-like amidohydrolase